MFSNIKKFILDLLFPIECLGCEKEGEWLCKKCFDTVEVEKTFPLLDVSENYLDGFFSALSYDQKVVQDILHAYKYNFVEDLGEVLGKLMVKYLQEHNLNFNQVDYILPVPLHRKRELQRGFNQAEILAKCVSGFLGKPLWPKNILIRKGYRSSQVKTKDRASRIENVKGIFECADCHSREGGNPVPDFIKNKKILLIDDVATTGATLSECAKVLKRSGAAKVVGLVAAKN